MGGSAADGLKDERARGPMVQIGAGTMADYHRLAAFHYRAGPPAVVAAVLVACDGGELAGVLVASMPTLNAWWRGLAWPGEYSGDKSSASARLNRDVRTIARVIIDPRWRGTGIAGELVRAYLAAPLTRRTEAVAAMGWVSPFFARAGMTPHVAGLGPRDAALSAWLRRRGVRACELIDERLARRALRRHRELEATIRRWARGSAATARDQFAPAVEIAALAGARLSVRPVAYTAERRGRA